MNTEMNGKKIARVIWNFPDGEEILHDDGERELVLSATYHGDRDEFWVLELRDGKEVSRHNCKFISGIVWA